MQADGTHVAHNLAGGLLEREVERALPAPGGGLGKECGGAGFPRAGRAREQNAAAAKKAVPAEHRVKPWDARGNPLAGRRVIQPQRRDGQHSDAVVTDEEGIFIGAMRRAAVFHHPQMPRGNLFIDPMVEHDDTVGHIFLQPMARQVFAPGLGSDERRHAFVFEPAEEPAQLGAQDGLVGQAGEQRFQRVQHHAFGADGINRVTEPDEQPFQVILAGLLDFTALDVNVIEQNFFAPDQARQIKSEQRDVALQLGFRLLEGHENARLAELHRSAHEEFRGQQRLAATRAAAHQRGPPARQPAAGDFVETLDARRTLGQTSSRRGGFGTIIYHLKSSRINRRGEAATKGARLSPLKDANSFHS